jgi:hypothetical protein
MASLLWLVCFANVRVQADEPEREMADANRRPLRPFLIILHGVIFFEV